MRRDMADGDGLEVTLGGVTHTFPPERMKVAVDETSTRGGTKHRYATLVVQLDDEFPEDMTAHLARIKDGG